MTEIDELIVQGVGSGGFPKSVYRYRNINDNFREMLIENKMWFSNPQDFNDPFDCKKNLEENYSDSEIKSYLVSLGVSRFEVTQLAKNIKQSDFKKIVSDSIDNHINKSYICCFSEKKDDLLMWGHYTYGHSGVCMRFDMRYDTNFFTFPVKVKYSDDYPKVNYLKNHNETVDKILTTKSNHWSYEKEIRVIKPFETKNKISFKKESLKEIIFGARTDKKVIDEIIDLMSLNGYKNVVFTKAILNNHEYKLDFKEINVANSK